MAIRVLLSDDDELVRRGVRDLLWVEEDLIVNAIRRVGHGESRLDPAVTARRSEAGAHAAHLDERQRVSGRPQPVAGR